LTAASLARPDEAAGPVVHGDVDRHAAARVADRKRAAPRFLERVQGGVDAARGVEQS
jgi:hypothetical protein